MLIKASDAHKKENSPFCTVWEYNFPKQELGLAIAHINGRYPTTGKAINHECEEMYYVLSGEWVLHDETGAYELKPWDCFLFTKGEPYWVEGKDLKVVLPSAPARFLSQHESIA
jgi:mannose-6-phosphate isomerase-like protein (cupin superfamily)